MKAKVTDIKGPAFCFLPPIIFHSKKQRTLLNHCLFFTQVSLVRMLTNEV